MAEIERRHFLAAAAALLAAPIAPARAARVHRIGVLWILPDAESVKKIKPWVEQGLRRAGYVPGKNIELEWPLVASPYQPLAAAASELVRRKVDLILALGNFEIVAARRATATIPIVMLGGWETQELGLIRSLAHPGGNVTGTAWQGPETTAKILQILKEAKPAATRIAHLFNPACPGNPRMAAAVASAASSLGVAVRPFEVRHASELPVALDRIAAYRPDALYLFNDEVIPGRRVAEFAMQHMLISIGTLGTYADWDGGLFAYAPNVDDLLASVVTYIDRILRGARPGDLPVELPARLVFTVNMKTARAIGYTVPQSLLLRADRVIE